MTPAMQRLHALISVIRAAAEAGKPCPTNLDLMEQVNLSVNAIQDILKRAEALGLIIVVRGFNTRDVRAADGSWQTLPTVTRPVPAGMRQGIKAAPASGQPAPARKTRPRAGAASLSAAIAAPPAAPPEPAPPPARLLPYDPPKRLVGACSWPMGEPGSEGFRFCDAPRRDLRCPYCPQHAGIAFTGRLRDVWRVAVR